MANLSAEQRARLLQRLRGGTAQAASPSPVASVSESSLPRRSDRTAAPLSDAQQRLWFLDQLEPGSSAYNETMALRLPGALDAGRLTRALTVLGRRHEVLRTTFTLRGEHPEQVIHEGLPVEVVEAVLAEDLDERAPVEDWPAAVRRHVQRPFELRTGPLLRTGLFALPDGRSLLIIVIHHIVTDGWSAPIFLRELTALYGADEDEAGASLAPLPVQYADYAAWQRAPDRRDGYERGLAFWREHLRGAPSDHGLPFATVPAEGNLRRGGVVTFAVPPEIAARLGELTRRVGCSLFVTLLGAFAVLLRRHSGRSDLVVGTPVANRGRREIAPLVGFFVNTLALRIDAGGSPGFSALLGQVHRTLLGALDHQDTPFERIVEALNPRRTFDRNPLFQVVMTLQDGALAPIMLGGMRADPVFLDPGVAKFDLTLHIENRSGRMSGRFEYDRGRCDLATIERLARSFEELLATVADAPDAPLDGLIGAPVAEARLALQDWNATAVDFDRAATLPDRWADQVRRQPDAVALVAGGETLTYEQLDGRANRWAQGLVARGVAVEDRVGLCLERGVDLLVAMLAVLKASAAYVPLDPDHPAERRSFMLADSGCRLLLTRAPLAGTMALMELPWIDPTVAFAGNTLPPTAPVVSLSSGNLAYLIYTSGSTGRPKAVAVAHRSVVNLALAQRAGFGITGEHRVAFFASLGFDASVSEIWTTFDAGATLVVADEDERASPLAIHAFLATRRINVVTLPPTVWAQMPADLPDLRVAVSAGERCPAEIVRRWHSAQCRFVNAYGPTEVTVCATLTDVGPDDVAPAIGRPIANAGAYVLDDEGRLVPIGVEGELYVGGEGVTRGYWGRAALTAERFVPHPFATKPGERLYRTGDLVRHRADGSLDYRGRADGQIKLRGYRIEPGEIEAVIEAHPAVTSGAVVVRERRGETELVAYVVPAVTPLPAAELRAHLRARLPDSMLPAAFNVLESLPRTVQGKVDRAALPDLAFDRETLSGDYVAPTTPTEAALVRLWSELLEVAKVGVHDDFFELGGHSLLAAQIVARIEAQLGVALRLRDFFEQPTVAQQARLLGERPGEVAGPMPPVAREGPIPISLLQERLWFLHQLEPTSADYNVPVALRWRGPVDVAALQQAVAWLAERHEVLRLTFDETDGRPVMRVAPETDAGKFTLETLPESQAVDPAAAHRWAVGAAARPFDLRRGPLWRMALLRLTSHEHVLLFTLHHIITDGWSMGTLVDELNTAYNVYATGASTGPALPLPPVQYPDFAAWQRRWFTAERLAPQIEYWREQLAGVVPFELPGDLPRSARLERRGRHLTFELELGLARALRSLSQECSATPFMTALAAFNVLLFRYTHTDDIAVGVPMSNRSRAGTEDMVGFFVNTLVLRTDLAGGPTFRELLARVRQRTLEAHANQDVPFDRLIEALKIPRAPGRPPLASVFFVWQNQARPARPPRDGTIEPLDLETGITKFDLTLELVEGDATVTGMFEFDRDLHSPAAVERLAGHFQELLRAIVADPDGAIRDLDFLPVAERDQVLGEWAGSRSPYPRDAAVHRLFEAQVAVRPEAVAIIVGTRRWTYAELDAEANRVAHFLRARGVRLDERVGVGLPRGFAQIAVVLGVLKAGAAYVPLDPESPLPRARAVVADSCCRLVIGSLCREAECADRESTAESLELAMPVMTLEQLATELHSQPTTALALPVDPLLTAYVIYTSGSTGVPKGVQVPHRGAVRLVMDTDFAEFGTDQTVMYHSPLSFDASTLEIWSALLQGGRLAILPPGPPALSAYAQWLRDYEVSTLWLTASLFHALVAEQVECLSGTRQVLAGGDVLQVPLVERLRQACPNTQIINGYGPTENTTLTTCHRVGRDEDLGVSVPIGRPIANTQIYILDERMRPVPPGVIGELFNGGDGLARGYANRPGFTAERFVPHPFGSEPGERLYRTGDYARFRSDGTVEFFGRMDFQVKIRGFRVELGEVESALAAHPAVSSCAVVAAPDPAGGKRIVAFHVTRVPVTSEDLRGFLSAHVPGYMVPAVFVALDEMPVSPNGKIDRKKLVGPAAQAGSAETTADGPRDATESALADIWRDLLGAARVGVHDNFFELGGHSLLATRVVSRIATILRVTVELHDFFDHPTIAELAAHVKTRQRKELPPIEPVDRASASGWPLSSAQERLWFVDRLAPGSANYNVPLVLRLSGPLDAAALSGALDGVVARHEAMRTVFPAERGVPRQVVRPVIGGLLRRVDLTQLPATEREAELRRRGEADAQAGFDLANGPLVRAQLLSFGPTEQALLVNFHHIITDGWSLGLFLRELAENYAALRAGNGLPPPLRLHYIDFAHWQRGRVDALAPHLHYWRTQLDGVPPLELPTDRPRPPEQRHRGARFDVQIAAETGQRLRTIGRPEGATLFMTLLAVFDVVLWRWSGQRDFAVGTPVANRNHPDVEDMIGFFVNTLVLRNRIEPRRSFSELLREVKQTALAAYAHQDLPFEQLVEALNVPRDRSRTPLFQVMLVLQNAPMALPELPGVAVEVREYDTGHAKFDLTVSFVEEADGGLAGAVEYDTDLYDRATVERLLASYTAALAQVAAEPDRAVGEIDVVPTRDRQWLLAEGGGDPRQQPETLAFTALFSRKVATAPHAVALVDGTRSLTYAELDAAANRLAHGLRMAGVGAETRVGLCFSRGYEMVVTILAVWKAGGAYVPLDPAYPSARLAFMLEDSGCSLVLVHGVAPEVLPATLARVVTWAELVRQTETVAATCLEVTIDPAQAAYLIYTSGSTGRPKAVLVPHRGIVNLVQGQVERFGLSAGSRVLQFASLNFDASVAEICATFGAGGTLVVAPDEARRSPVVLAALLRDEHIGCVTLPPTLWTALEGEFPELHAPVSAGERCSAALVERWSRPGRPLLNAYGPSEVTVCSTTTKLVAGATGSPPIGRPLPNTTAYVLAVDGTLAPRGVPGELHVGGAGVTRGYQGRPGLTAERFVPDSFGGEAGARLYRTGDVARWRPDGQLEFLGRTDDQVKLRGMRVELGEIENVLVTHEAVEQCVVICRPDAQGADRLIAYVVGVGAARTELQAHLKARLPDHMVPAVFVSLAALPLSPSGKVDHQSLPDPAADVSVAEGSAEAFEGPQGEVEAALAADWCVVLDLPRVGRHDNFFEVGGNSMKAVQLLERFEPRYPGVFTIGDLFDHHTLAQQAVRIAPPAPLPSSVARKPRRLTL